MIEYSKQNAKEFKNDKFADILYEDYKKYDRRTVQNRDAT